MCNYLLCSLYYVTCNVATYLPQVAGETEMLQAIDAGAGSIIKMLIGQVQKVHLLLYMHDQKQLLEQITLNNTAYQNVRFRIPGWMTAPILMRGRFT